VLWRLPHPSLTLLRSGGCDKLLQALVQIVADGDRAHNDEGANDVKGEVVECGGRERGRDDEERRGYRLRNQLIRWLECRLDAGVSGSSS
jgi:hypothetical protein